MQPNLKPERAVAADRPGRPAMSQVPAGQGRAHRRLPASGLADLPLPLLFGCIPLSAVIEEVAGSAPAARRRCRSSRPRRATQVESLRQRPDPRLPVRARLSAATAARWRQAAIDVLNGILQDLLDQAVALAQAQVAPVIAAVNQLKTALTNLRSQFNALVPAVGGDLPGIDTVPSLAALPGLIDTVLPKVAAIGTAVNGATLPSGFKQSRAGPGEPGAEHPQRLQDAGRADPARQGAVCVAGRDRRPPRGDGRSVRRPRRTGRQARRRAGRDRSDPHHDHQLPPARRRAQARRCSKCWAW